MKYRPLGKTGLRLSEIVFGAGAVGGMMINLDESSRRAALYKALDSGINWIDTAPSYGNGKSEENLGACLKNMRPQPYVSTKVRPDPSLGDIPGQVERSIAESLKRLQRSSVELLQLHNPVTQDRGARQGSLSVDDVLGPGGVLEALRKARDQRLTRFAGFTAVGDTTALHRLVKSGGFDTAQVYYNLLNPSAGRSVPQGFSAHDYGNLIGACAENGTGVLVIRVLAAGVIASTKRTGREGTVSPGSDVESDTRRAALVRQALNIGQGNMAKPAIRFALSDKRVSGVLVGFSTLAHIDDALDASSLGPLEPAAMQRLDKLYLSDFGGLTPRP